MDSARQIIRYSVPGGLFVLVAAATYILARVLWGESLTEVEALTKVTTSLTAIAASVPLGFVIYQGYYASYTPLVRKRYITRDRGAELLRGLDQRTVGQLRVLFDARLDIRKSHRPASGAIARGLRLLELDYGAFEPRYKPDEKTDAADSDGFHVEYDPRSLRRIYSDNWHENWYALRALLDLLEAHGDGKVIKDEFINLSDVYHALGASRVAVIAGWVVAIAYVATAHNTDIGKEPWLSCVALVLSMAGTGFVALVIHTTRRLTWNTAEATLRYGLRWCISTSEKLPEVLPAPGEPTPRRNLRQQRVAPVPLPPGRLERWMLYRRPQRRR